MSDLLLNYDIPIGELDNFTKKKIMVNNLLKLIKKKQDINYKKWRQLKKINTIIRPSLTALNALSVSSLILSISPLSPIFIILALSFSTTSAVGFAIMDAVRIDMKISNYHMSYLQFSDLYRTTNIIIKKNHMTSNDYDLLLNELNTKIGLIEDSQQ